ncbi:hypothetical protein PR048_011738 [Dryococelus australis]|uniref:Uncharacterized protein n=1 Tax=Dryococelus australis TaxID=614101 RepID=A0ABQ9HMC8_9NEOP|nr:hypothetical protein PR048_011738 [Dryococelus australis]
MNDRPDTIHSPLRQTSIKLQKDSFTYTTHNRFSEHSNALFRTLYASSMHGAWLPNAHRSIAMSQYSLHLNSIASLAPLSSAHSLTWCSGKLLALHHGEPGSIPGGLDPRRGRSRLFACGNRAGRSHWSAGLLRNPLFTPLLNSGAAPYSPRSTLIGFQDLNVKIRPNIFTHSL